MRRREFLTGLTTLMATGSLAAGRAARGSWSSQRLVAPSGNRRFDPVVTALAVQTGGPWLATAGDDHAIGLWRLPEGRFERWLQRHSDWVRALAFSADGNHLASAGNDRAVWLWDARNDWQARRLSGGPNRSGERGAICGLAFDSSGRLLATVGFESSLRLYDLRQDAWRRPLACPCSDMRAVAFAPTRPLLAAAGRNGLVRVWNSSDGKVVAQRRLHSRRVRDLAFSADSRWLVSAGEDCRLHAWQLEQDRVASFDRLPGKILAVVFCGDARVATAGSDNQIRIWDLNRRQEVERLTAHAGSVSALAFHDGQLVSGSYDTTVRLWTEQASHTLEVSTPVLESH